MSQPIEGLARRTRKNNQSALFEIEPAWSELWWGMPEFVMGDARPMYSVCVNFYTLEDLIEFGNRIGSRVTSSTDSITFPAEKIDDPSQWRYVDA